MLFKDVEIMGLFKYANREFLKTEENSALDILDLSSISLYGSASVTYLDNIVDVYKNSKLTKYSDLKLYDCFIHEGRGYMKCSGFSLHIESGVYRSMPEEKLVEKTKNVKEMLCKSLQPNS